MSTGGSTPISSSAGSVNADGNSGDGGGQEDRKIDDKTPLWAFVKKISKPPSGGNWRWQCSFCNMYYNRSYTRVRAHLLSEGGGIVGCPKVSVNSEVKSKLFKLMKECKERLTNAAPKQVPLPSTRHQGGSAATSSVGLSTFHAYAHEPTTVDTGKKRKTVDGSSSIEKAFQNSVREECDAEVARMFYTGGLPFNLARNPHYRNSYIRASTLPGYVPPRYNAIRTTLLAKEKKNIEKHLQPLKLSWKDKGVSVCSDGWSDAQRRPLINVIAISESGPMMLRAINCQGEYKDSDLIANLIIESIKEVGYENVVQVITDNGPVCAKAGAMIASKYPTIFWTPCVVHTLNLALKNICTPSNCLSNLDVYEPCSWIQPIAEHVMYIKNFIINHGMRLVMFNDQCPLKLLSVAPTRFVSTVIMFKRFKAIKNGLQQIVISTKWDDYRLDDKPKAARVKEMLLDDLMWDDIDYILDFTEPMYEIIRKADTDKSCLHLMYEWWDNMIVQVKKVIYRKERKELQEESLFWNAVHKVLMARWTKSNTPLHCLAHSLNPKYYSSEWLNEATHRVAPHKDLEITRERKACLMRYFADEDEKRKLT
ncbi:uncharacterized protein LOC126803442 [Argentina anserina]|uniref:uncharacterized protein LOC126803442 n=1 Tax=Argentina anserina TaxID=57926 RepID=UPI00217634BF|nr:uncharacterized protein LOC126803442 [Potentilla anserina]